MMRGDVSRPQAQALLQPFTDSGGRSRPATRFWIL